ncbi:LPXTG cell wall anchor domain-containing protein [Streptomyces spectabilis]|uniref:LPXTG cell wall anchor domain-containing protein n=1 Tax=Streptomyces spectabilis TaxID=68270 RepID=A0A516R8G4_STRST|nr:LPXTG cell wall anchor domain-containing protein [Streptomyces spectabilis]QDQ11952.1 LPXTG cell wall anchor domain-containing protein [Streptomyces spectabilis]
MPYQRKPTALALTAALAGSALLLTAPVARAEVQDVDYQCRTPIGNKGAVSPIDIKSVRSGSGYKLTMSFQKGVSSSPVELGKGAMKPSALIELGGAESGTVPVSGPPNSGPIPANTPIRISTLTGTYTPKKSGKVTFTAGVLTIKALGTTTTCTPANDPKPSLTLTVKGSGSAPGPGGGSGADSGSGAGDKSGSGSGSGDASDGSRGAPSGGEDLPQTGPADSAIALGTLGGTVLLAGAAGVLWLTRRNQAPR